MQIKRSTIFVLILAVLLWANCAKTDTLGVCNEKDITYSCSEYVGSNWTTAKASADCPSGYTASGNCPTTGKFGQCVVGAGSQDEKVIFYYPPQTTTGAQGACGLDSGAYSAL